MRTAITRDPALRLWRAETRWLDQCATRLRQARSLRQAVTTTGGAR